MFRLGGGFSMSDDVAATDCEAPAVTGELVVLNGQRKGLRIPLRLPLTLIGSGEACDIRVDSPEVVGVHCAIAHTPLGPTLRSWHPDQTYVNGNEAASRVLKTNDELRVGPCVLRVVWQVEDLIPLVAAPQDEPLVELVPAYPSEATSMDYALTGREYGDEEQSVAALFEARQHRLAALMRELADHREEFRRQKADGAKDRGRIRAARVEADRLRDAAREERDRARTLFTRLRRRFHAKWKEERDARLAERTELGRHRHQLERMAEDLRVGRAASLAEMEAYRQRLHHAWEMLTEGQRRLLADRRESERAHADREAALRMRAEELAAQEKELTTQRTQAADRVRSLQSEIARLEMRAKQAQLAVQKLEGQRSRMEPSALHAADLVVIDGRPAGDVDQLLSELQLRERELTRERVTMASAHTTLERHAAELVDQRRVLAEQTTTLLLARRAWQAAEIDTLANIEHLARQLVTRELELQARENETELAERRVREQVENLWALRTKLEGWQTQLTLQEQSVEDTRRRADAELAAKREHLQRWEAALGTLCRKWATARKRELHQLRREVSLWSEARARHRLALADIDAARQELLAEAARVAEQSLAAEQLLSALTDDGAKTSANRRVRVLKRKWEAHFAEFLKDIVARRFALSIEAGDCDDRYRKLERQMQEVGERRTELLADEQRFEAEKLTRSREGDDREAVLSVEAARHTRTGTEITAVREEVERMAAALMDSDVLPHPCLTGGRDLIPLTDASRAA